MRDLFGSDAEPVVAEAPCPRAAMPVSAATASCSPGQPVTSPDVEADFLAPDKADVERPRRSRASCRSEVLCHVDLGRTLARTQ